MSTDAEIKAKRAHVDQLRKAVRDEKRQQAAAVAEASGKVKLDALSAEEQSLEAELAALRANAPKAPAPTPKPTSDAASTKE